jgi:hypothetical protein
VTERIANRVSARTVHCNVDALLQTTRFARLVKQPLLIKLIRSFNTSIFLLVILKGEKIMSSSFTIYGMVDGSEEFRLRLQPLE